MGLVPGDGKNSHGLQVLNAVRQGLVRAERYVRNPKEFLRLLTLAEGRLERLALGPLTPLKHDLQTLLRMLRASGEGQYRQVSKKNLLLAGLGVLYIVSPLDVIPDFLPGGFADDAAVIGFVMKKIRGELTAFEAWERRDAIDV